MDGRVLANFLSILLCPLFRIPALCFGLLVALLPSLAQAQRIQFAPNQPVPSNPAGVYSAFQGPSFGTNPLPSNNWLPQTPPTFPSASPSFGASPFGAAPFNSSVRPTTAGVLPSVNPNTNWGFPTAVPQNLGQPPLGSSLFPNSYPSSIYPNATPNAIFPGTAPNTGWGTGGFGNSFGAQPGYGYQPNNGIFGGLFQQPIFNGWGNGLPNGGINGQYNNGLGSGWYSNPNGPLINGFGPQPMRFFLGPRFRHTWVASDKDPTSLETNDSDLSLVFGIPNFLASNQPLYLIPSFSMHTFEGPRLATADIPSRAYSAFLDAGWESDPIRTFGLELGARVGIFSNFDTFNSDSLRVMGKALGRVRLTPNATLRGGAFYIDRNRYKIIPAGGILWLPNQDTRFDLFFPEPKLAHYLTTVGTQDVWWYLTGYYGGGTWTVTRASGDEDSIDINDFRIALGLDFGRNDTLRQGRRLGFIEAGYAFHRELLFDARPMDNTDLQDAFVLRAGIGY